MELAFCRRRARRFHHAGADEEEPSRNAADDSRATRARRAACARCSFARAATLGIRVRREKRYALPRHHEAVATPWGEVRMKVAGVNGTASQYAPEYEDCRRIAAEHHVPLKT